MKENAITVVAHSVAHLNEASFNTSLQAVRADPNIHIFDLENKTGKNGWSHEKEICHDANHSTH